jgi:uncharacterized membrane protein
MQNAASAPTVGINLSTLPLGQIVPLFFLLVFVIWLIHSLVASYHWLRYSGNKMLSITMIVTHVLVSSVLAIYAVSGLH